MSKKTQKPNHKDAFMKLGLIFIIILVLANTIQIASMGSIVERVDRYNQGVVDELGGFREDIIAFGNDMNEMRSYLLLPTKNYSFVEGEEPLEEDKQETSQTQQALYQFLSTYAEEQKRAETYEAAKQELNNINQNPEVVGRLAELELNMDRVQETEQVSSFKISAGTNPLFAVLADTSSAQLKIQSILGTEELSANDPLDDLYDYVSSNKDKVIEAKELLEQKKNGLANLESNQNITAILQEKNITFNKQSEEDEQGFNYHFMNVEGENIVTVTLSRDGQYQLNDKTFEAEEQMVAALTETLKEIDASTALEQVIAERRDEIETIIKEEPFQELLDTNGLTIQTEPREEYNKLLYDVKNTEGQNQFSFVIELSSGMFKILQGDQEVDLNSILLGSKKKP